MLPGDFMKQIAVGEGSFRVTLGVEGTNGSGVCAFLFGGDTPHVGGVVLGVPQRRLWEDGLTCDISQICLPAHKDVFAGAEVAKILAMGTNQPVAVTCGVHVDNANSEDIAKLLENCRLAAREWLERYGQCGF